MSRAKAVHSDQGDAPHQRTCTPVTDAPLTDPYKDVAVIAFAKSSLSVKVDKVKASIAAEKAETTQRVD